MSVPFSNTKLRVPQGFQTLLETITREILRNKPANIYDFAATYLENLVQDKKEGRLDDSMKQSLLDDRFYNNHSFKESYPINNKSVDTAAVIIQSSVRSHQTREHLESDRSVAEEPKKEPVQEKHHEEPALVQHTKAKPAEEKPADEKPAEEKPAETVNNIIPAVVHKQAEEKPTEVKQETPKEEQKKHEEAPQQQEINVEEPSVHDFGEVELARRVKSPDSAKYDEYLKHEQDVHNAATKIQSTFRGFKTRKELEEKGNEESNNNHNINAEDNQESEAAQVNHQSDDEAAKTEAATKIQATFRGFQTRRNLTGPSSKPE